MRKRFFLACVILGITFSPLVSQNISGVINAYSPVTAIGCNHVVVTNPALFAAGDRVLLIQMQGAAVATSNNATFGSLTSYGNAGHYEFANVVSVFGNTVNFQFGTLNQYTPGSAGNVQLIRVPQYTSATVTAPLTCLPWNGQIGGVLVMEVSGTLTMNDKIDVSGNGFRGGTQCTNPDGACGAGYTDYFYAVSSGYGAQKGEGICVPQTGLDGGRGAWANGGGGGNKHNSGGGGGSNFSEGGHGGNQANFCPVTPMGGTGGYPMIYTQSIFMGGGGGCSDNNNAVGTPGQNGGGIIIIKAGTLAGNNDSILSNGNSCGYIINNIGDGAGGGGAGGTILLSVGSYSSGVVVHANGGDGGDQNTGYSSCFGPGGGGGVGTVWFSQATTPGGATVATNPGAPGIDLNPTSQCFNQSYGATAGLSGTGQLFNLLLPEGNMPPILVNIGNDSTLCAGNVTLNAGNPGSTYQWSTGANSQTIQVSNAGTYWVTVTSTSGCSTTDTIVFSGSYLYVDLGADTVICGGTQLQLNAQNNFAVYQWSTGDTTSAIAVTTSGTYSVVLTDTTGCSVSDIISVNFQPALVVDLGSDSTYCSGLIMVDAGNPGNSYIWNTGATSQSILISNGGMYWVTVTTPAGCVESDTILLVPAVQVSAGSDVTECLGNSVTLTATGTATAWLWSTGATTPSITVNAGGQYWVTGTASSCGGTDTINVILETFAIELGPDITTCDTTYTLVPSAQGTSYLWSTGENTPSIVINATGSYSVTVTSGNCTSTDAVSVDFISGLDDVNFPNVFTPNQDGINDHFMSLAPTSTPVDLQIFDRWGNCVAQLNGINPIWDGTTVNGEDVTEGVYFWILKYRTECNGEAEATSKTGFVTILRTQP